MRATLIDGEWRLVAEKWFPKHEQVHMVTWALARRLGCDDGGWTQAQDWYVFRRKHGQPN